MHRLYLMSEVTDSRNLQIPDVSMVSAVTKKPKAREELGQPVPSDANLTLRHRNTMLVLLLIILCWTIVVFFPVLQNGFVNWDDDRNLLENRNFRGLDLEQLRWMFTTFHMTLYRPLTWVSFGLDYLFWAMNPSGYHLTSLLLHAVNAIIFYFVALRLLRLTIATNARVEFYLQLAAGFSALLFALHPLRVEAVAWASARNDVLSGTFYLATILCYLKATEVRSTGRSSKLWMTSAVVVYGLSLLSKAIGMTLPFVLLLLDVYPLRRLGTGPGPWFGSVSRKVWWEKGPFLLLAVGAGVIALLAKQRATYSFEEIGLSQRLAQSAWGLIFYLWKTVVPLGLSPLYELSYLDTSGWPSLISLLLFFVLSIGLFLARHRWPACLASWVYYVIVLAPVIGVAQSGPQLVADRYTYLSCLGWALLAGAALYCGWRSAACTDRLTKNSVVPGALAAVVLGGLSLLTWNQTWVWHNSETLWMHALSVGPRSSYAHNNLGNALFERGKIEEATNHYRDALQINPGHAKAHNNLANGLVNQGKLDEAIVHYREALRIDPAYARAHYNLANTLVGRGRLEEAIYHFREAVRNDPNYAKAQYNLGIALAKEGELAEAIKHFGQVLRVDSENAAAHEALARTLALQGKNEQAAHHYQEALRILKSRSEPSGSR
jgi:protein O-mannosyl-transferase